MSDPGDKVMATTPARPWLSTERVPILHVERGPSAVWRVLEWLGLVLDYEREAIITWWRKRSPFSWETVRDTGLTLYQVHPSGRRRAVQIRGAYQPIDRRWLETGEWSTLPRRLRAREDRRG